MNESSRKVDPTLNPITRRPGPGRGRPRKQPAPVPGEMGPPQHAPLPTPTYMGPPSQIQMPAPPGLPGIAPEAMPTSFPSPPAAPELQEHSAHLHPLQSVQQPQNGQPQPSIADKDGALTPSQSTANTQSPPKPEHSIPLESESLVPQPEDDIDDDGEEPDAKRRRLDLSDPSKEDLDDEAVLALAAHNGSVDPFPSEYVLLSSHRI